MKIDLGLVLNSNNVMDTINKMNDADVTRMPILDFYNLLFDVKTMYSIGRNREMWKFLTDLETLKRLWDSMSGKNQFDQARINRELKRDPKLRKRYTDFVNWMEDNRFEKIFPESWKDQL